MERCYDLQNYDQWRIMFVDDNKINFFFQVIAQLTSENACLRELLNISTLNEPGNMRQFLKTSFKKGGEISSAKIFKKISECEFI